MPTELTITAARCLSLLSKASSRNPCFKQKHVSQCQFLPSMVFYICSRIDFWAARAHSFLWSCSVFLRFTYTGRSGIIHAEETTRFLFLFTTYDGFCLLEHIYSYILIGKYACTTSLWLDCGHLEGSLRLSPRYFMSQSVCASMAAWLEVGCLSGFFFSQFHISCNQRFTDCRCCSWDRPWNWSPCVLH